MVALLDNVSAALADMDLPDVVVVRNNITLKRVTMQWPKAGIQQFPTERPAPVPGKPHLRAICAFRMADDEIKLEAGLPVEAVYVECQIANIGYWSIPESWHYRGSQCCAPDSESLAAEALAYAMIG